MMEGAERPKRVVIADDDEDTRTLLAEILEDEPTVELVGTAKDADEAVRLVAEVEPDVAILDWRMPGGGGGTAARKIKNSSPDTAVIALTGMDPTHASHEMMTAGAIGFLEKGCTREQLVDTIRSVTRW